ncbi:MAG: phosphohistidine phosphatase SixA [Gammaproteobacteria bacterium]
MRVYLVQHGDAVPKEVDPDRPLSDTGRRGIERLARFLVAAKMHVSRIVHSGKTRAQQTAEILAKDLGRNVSIGAMSGLNPDDPPKKFAKQIEEIGDGTVIVSHLPFLGLLVSRLVADDEDQPVVSFKPGSAVCIEKDEGGRWSMTLVVRPEHLSD